MVERVIADPWPDGPRQAFAATIPGTDRARLIADELTVLRARRAGRQARAEEARVVPLRARVAIAIRPELADLAGTARFGVGRGFYESVRAPFAWLDAHPELFERAPILDVTVTELGEDLPRLLTRPWLRRVRWLGLAQNALGDEAVARIAAADLPRLCALDLAANRVGAAGLDALGRTSLPSLRFVILGGNPCEDPNHETRWEGEVAVGPVPTPASERFRSRYPECRWVGRYSADDPPMPGALHDADGRAL